MAFSSFLILQILLSILQALAYQATSPALLWANYNFFSVKNMENSNLVQVEDLQNAITNGNQLPEIAVIFVEPKLGTEQFSVLADAGTEGGNGGAFSNLKQFVSDSASSMIFSHVNSESTGIATSVINNLVGSVGSTILVRDDLAMLSDIAAKKGVRTMSLSTFHSELKLNNYNQLLHNGMTDLIVICFGAASPASPVAEQEQKFTVDDKFIASTIEALQSSRYMAAFLSEQPFTAVKSTLPSFFTGKMIQQALPGNTNFTMQNSQGSDYWPDTVMMALIILVPFVTIGTIGFCCALQLQSDFKFDLEKPKRQ